MINLETLSYYSSFWQDYKIHDGCLNKKHTATQTPLKPLHLVGTHLFHHSCHFLKQFYNPEDCRHTGRAAFVSWADIKPVPPMAFLVLGRACHTVPVQGVRQKDMCSCFLCWRALTVCSTIPHKTLPDYFRKCAQREGRVFWERLMVKCLLLD